MELLLISYALPKFVTCVSSKYPRQLRFKLGCLNFSTFVLDLGLTFSVRPLPHFASRLLSSSKGLFLSMEFSLLTAQELYFLLRQVDALAIHMGLNL